MLTFSFPVRAVVRLFRGVAPLLLLALSASHTGAQTAPSLDIRDDQFAVAYQVNVAHTSAITLDQSFAPPLHVLWNETAEGPIYYPLIARGKVFVWVSHFTDQAQIHNPAQNTGRLYALDKTTGTVLWQADLAAKYGFATIAYDEGRVFVLTSDGILAAFDADAGTTAWSVQLASTFADAPPTAANGMIFIGASTDESRAAGTLFAIDEADGTVRWSQPVDNGDGSSPALSGNGVFVAYSCHDYGFNPVTGAPLWHIDVPSCTAGTSGTPVAYYRGFLYDLESLTLGFGGMDVIDTNTGQVARTVATQVMGPAFQGSVGYAAQLDKTLNVVAFDVASGNTLWSRDTTSSYTVGGPLPVAPLVVNDFVYALDYGGTLHAYDRVSGDEVWNANGGPLPPSPTPVASALAAGEGVLVVPIGIHLYALAP